MRKWKYLPEWNMWSPETKWKQLPETHIESPAGCVVSWFQCSPPPTPPFPQWSWMMDGKVNYFTANAASPQNATCSPVKHEWLNVSDRSLWETKKHFLAAMLIVNVAFFIQILTWTQYKYNNTGRFWLWFWFCTAIKKSHCFNKFSLLLSFFLSETRWWCFSSIRYF